MLKPGHANHSTGDVYAEHFLQYLPSWETIIQIVDLLSVAEIRWKEIIGYGHCGHKGIIILGE